jgi:threonine/homoserine/homoserine lactone efflux protein
MGEAIGQMLPLAVAIAVNPVPVIVVVLLLGSVRARANGPAFAAGWFAGILILGAIVLVIADAADASDDGRPSTWVSVLKLALGAALVLLAVQQWRGRLGADDEAEVPAWMGAIDAFTPAKAAGAGVALSAVNPKNLLFVVGAAATDSQADVAGKEQALVWALFAVVASAGVIVPVVIYFALGDRAQAVLDPVRNWLIRNKGAVVAILCLVIGAGLIGGAIEGFTA